MQRFYNHSVGVLKGEGLGSRCSLSKRADTTEEYPFPIYTAYITSPSVSSTVRVLFFDLGFVFCSAMILASAGPALAIAWGRVIVLSVSSGTARCHGSVVIFRSGIALPVPIHRAAWLLYRLPAH